MFWAFSSKVAPDLGVELSRLLDGPVDHPDLMGALCEGDGFAFQLAALALR